eukprot:2673317-Rhodomonas_salina.2
MMRGEMIGRATIGRGVSWERATYKCFDEHSHLHLSRARASYAKTAEAVMLDHARSCSMQIDLRRCPRPGSTMLDDARRRSTTLDMLDKAL